MGYPDFHIQSDQNTIKPKVLFVGDSFMWGWFNERLFGEGDFWYYNEMVYFGDSMAKKKPLELDLIHEIEKHDVIILLSTDANLFKFPYGFVDRLYNTFISSDSLMKNE